MMTPHEMLLDMAAKIKTPHTLAVGLLEAVRLAKLRMSESDFETFCEGIADTILEANE